MKGRTKTFGWFDSHADSVPLFGTVRIHTSLCTPHLSSLCRYADVKVFRSMPLSCALTESLHPSQEVPLCQPLPPGDAGSLAQTVGLLLPGYRLVLRQAFDVTGN
ncbi:hypothetical protein EYF80_041713 [Liparis tanakae]|uniref:Uncharacterized protein n=1 Tax=Liparis tanakae TaxID=230148 RepID=A0A4Z2G3H9_9TELE|nr:hypothetical protein EYF80_041713 [Liparis tanakae]